MSTPIPPTIPADGQFSAVQIDQYLKNDGSTTGNVVSNGYVTEKGSFTTITGQDQTYSASAIAGGIIIRTGTTVAPSNDVLPTASNLASELGLPNVDGASYTRSFAIYNNNGYFITLSGTGWSFPGTANINGYYSMTFYYNLTYSIVSGWSGVCLSSGLINLD
jgi:hypothetical protein